MFDFILCHSAFYEDHALLFDWLVSDFSYANFHAILLAFNGQSLKSHLNLAKTWLDYKAKHGQFPESFLKVVKIRMCYTHLMHTFAEMCKRLLGKHENKQLPQSRIILEILAAMIRTTEYTILIKLWVQLVILLKTEYVNGDVDNALASVNLALTIDLNDYDEEKLTCAIDVEMLPEYESSLYKSNMFYIEFAAVSEKFKNTVRRK